MATLSLLMLRDGSMPFAEDGSGDVLSTFNRAVLGQVFYTTNNFELRSDFIDEWIWNKDEKSYEFRLKANLKFHDGSEILAEDLEFALLRGYFTKWRSFYGIYLENIIGIDALKEDVVFQSGLVGGVRITGPLSLKLFLKNANPNFIYGFSRAFFCFHHRLSYQDDLTTWRALPLGAGAYSVDSVEGNALILDRKKSVSGPEKVHIYTREVNGVAFDISFFPHEKTTEIYATKEPSAIYTLFFTNKNELSLNTHFRRAIKLGVDRNAISSAVPHSNPAVDFLPNSAWRSAKAADSEFDRNEARRLFSMIPSTIRLRVWRIPVFCNGEFSEQQKKANEQLAIQLGEIGMRVEFYPSKEKFLSEDRAVETPFSLSGRVCNIADPLLMFSSFKTGSAYKYDNAQNDKVFDQLYERAASASTSAERLEMLKQVSEYAVTGNFMIPLYEEPQIYFYNPNTVESLGNQSNPITLFLEEIVMR
ncbi:MAG: hypothetical protein H7333_11415 [Bdellovibrionales bacterium]|nr:hypothetical protein [Oligoflexia bacterium]